MDKYIIKYNELTGKQYIDLWNSVWDEAPTILQADLAMSNTLIRISIYDQDKLIAMARAIGDKGICYYIKDVVVIPEYQGKGIGKLLIEELLKSINNNGIKGTKIYVELAAFPEVKPFYEKCGFTTNEAERLKMMYEVK